MSYSTSPHHSLEFFQLGEAPQNFQAVEFSEDSEICSPPDFCSFFYSLLAKTDLYTVETQKKTTNQLKIHLGLDVIFYKNLQHYLYIPSPQFPASHFVIIEDSEKIRLLSYLLAGSKNPQVTKLNGIQKKDLAIHMLNGYISKFKFSPFGHHHNDRAKALIVAIRHPHFDTVFLYQLLFNQLTIFLAKIFPIYPLKVSFYAPAFLSTYYTTEKNLPAYKKEIDAGQFPLNSSFFRCILDILTTIGRR